MKLDIIRKNTYELPFMSPLQGEILYRFLTVVQPNQCLELGFLHGVSSCYIAAALHENGTGKLTTIDLEKARELSPNIDELLDKIGLEDFVTPIYSESDYNWELMKIVEANTHNDQCEPVYDFCYIDGSHIWNIDGLAFFLVEKLLKPGGWLLFDDIYWTLQENYHFPKNEFLKRMSEEQQSTPHVYKIFSLLVRQHPHIKFAVIRNDPWAWGWAQKGREDYGTETTQYSDFLKAINYAYDLVSEEQ